jgi:hypothetical protein
MAQYQGRYRMMKSLILIPCLFFLASCQNIKESSNHDNLKSQQELVQKQEFNESISIQDFSSSDEKSFSQESQEASLFETNISLSDFNPTQEIKVLKAIEIIKRVVRSQEFKEKVLQFTYKGKNQFVDNNGLTNAEIYQKLLEGSEELSPSIDYEMDLELELYYSRRSTVGYTYPDELKVWINTKFFNTYTPAQVAGNIFHEWTHKLGFEHAYRYSSKRDASVPYALGYLVEELGKKYL